MSHKELIITALNKLNFLAVLFSVTIVTWQFSMFS